MTITGEMNGSDVNALATLTGQDWPGTEAQLRREIAELQQQKEGLNGRLDAALARGDRYITERDSALAAVDSLSATCGNYVTERTVLLNERDAAVNRNGELATELMHMTEQRDTYFEREQRLLVQLEEVRTARDEVGAKNNELANQLEELEARLSNVGAQLRVAEGQRDRKEMELDQFKERVVAVACEQAEAHGWCSVIDDVLGQLGLERPAKSYTGTLQITVTFNAEMASRRDEPSYDWVRDSIRTHELQRAINQAFAMDADHDGVNVTDVEFEVTDVEMDD